MISTKRVLQEFSGCSPRYYRYAHAPGTLGTRGTDISKGEPRGAAQDRADRYVRARRCGWGQKFGFRMGVLMLWC